MQKKLIALAIAGLASGAAFAQSNVTIYGVADLSFDNVRVDDSKTSGLNTGSRNRVSANSSYIGFKGSEALGNGLTAVFQYETGVAADGGNTAGGTPTGLFSASGIRDSFVGVAGGFGTVVLGTLTGPTRALGAAVDVNSGATGNGYNGALLGKIGGNTLLGVTAPIVGNQCSASSTCTSFFDTRFSQAIAYVSPTFGGGFSGVVGYVANENRTNDGTPSSLQLNTSGYDLGLNYNNGPILGGLTYSRADVKNAGDYYVDNLRIAGKYEFAAASIRALWERTRLEGNNGLDLRADKYGLGATFNVTPAGKIIGQWYHANDIKGQNNVSNSSANLYEIGYEHSLSKRTILIASYQRLDNKDNAAYDFGINAAGTSAASAATPFASTAVGGGSNISSIQLGVRHSF